MDENDDSKSTEDDEVLFTWEDLKSSIEDSLKSKEFNKSYIIQVLSQYKSNEEDWSQYVFFNEQFYTRNLVDAGNGIYNMMILAWNPGQTSCIHDHPDSCCFVKVLAGVVQEIRYETPEEGKELTVIGDYIRQRDDVSYIEDFIGIHEMKNSNATNQAVSLHVYIPPFDTCNKFEQNTGTRSMYSMSFSSIYGELIRQEEKIDEGGASSMNPCC